MFLERDFLAIGLSLQGLPKIVPPVANDLLVSATTLREFRTTVRLFGGLRLLTMSGGWLGCSSAGGLLVTDRFAIDAAASARSPGLRRLRATLAETRNLIAASY